MEKRRKYREVVERDMHQQFLGTLIIKMFEYEEGGEQNT